MLGAFVRLTWWSFRNRVRVRLRRLREPRYLAGALAAIAWFYFFVLRRGFQGRGAGSSHPRPQIGTPFEDLTSHREAAVFGVALLLFVAALLVAAFGGKALEFSRAEVQFLFPAPIARRQLLNYKLVRSQGGLLFGTAIATLLLRPGTLQGRWMFLIGFWIALGACRLYSIAVGLDRGSLVARGAGWLRGRRALVAIWIAAAALLGSAAAASWSRLTSMTTGRQQFEELRQIWSVGLPRIVLWPFVTLADLPLSPSTDVFLSGLPGALLIVAAVYAWVISAGVAPEDASSPAEGGGAEGRRASRGKPAGSRQPFNLALEGRPETAILWKNLILVGRHVSLSTLLRVPLLLLPLAIVFVTGRRGGGGTLAFVAIVCLTLAGMVLLLGPHVARNDLRQDLTKLGVLKSWPVSGASIIRGELLAPAIVLSVGAWLLVLVGALAFQGLPVRPGTRAVALHAHMASYTAAAMVLAPALIVAQLVVQNGIAVLFPAWMTLGRSRVRGIEGIGQQMLTTWGGFLVAALFLAPPAAGAAIVMFAVYSATQTIGVLAPAAVLLALLVAQSLLVTGWLGRVLDRTDLAAVDPVE